MRDGLKHNINIYIYIYICVAVCVWWPCGIDKCTLSRVRVLRKAQRLGAEVLVGVAPSEVYRLILFLIQCSYGSFLEISVCMFAAAF